MGQVDLRFMSQGDPVRDSVDVPIVRFGADGQVIDTAGWHPRLATSGSPERISAGQSTFTVPQPPPMTPIRDYTATVQIMVEREVAGDEPTVRLVRQTLSGDTVRVRSFPVRVRPYSDDYLDSLAVQRAHVTGTLVTFEDGEIETLERHAEDTAAARVAIRAAMDFPEVQPPVHRIHLTSEGAVWLEQERMGDGWERWVVLSPGDEPIGRFRLPTGVRLSRADSRGFWAVEQDEFDIPWVVRYRFVEPEEGAGP